MDIEAGMSKEAEMDRADLTGLRQVEISADGIITGIHQTIRTDRMDKKRSSNNSKSA